MMHELYLYDLYTTKGEDASPGDSCHGILYIHTVHLVGRMGFKALLV